VLAAGIATLAAALRAFRRRCSSAISAQARQHAKLYELWLQQLRQLSNVRRDPARLVLCEQRAVGPATSLSVTLVSGLMFVCDCLRRSRPRVQRQTRAAGSGEGHETRLLPFLLPNWVERDDTER